MADEAINIISFRSAVTKAACGVLGSGFEPGEKVKDRKLPKMQGRATLEVKG